MSCSIVARHRCQWQDWEIAIIVLCRQWSYVSFAFMHLERTQIACVGRSSKIWNEGYRHLPGVVAELKVIRLFMDAHPELVFCKDILKAYMKARELEKLVKLVESSGYKIAVVGECANTV